MKSSCPSFPVAAKNSLFPTFVKLLTPVGLMLPETRELTKIVPAEVSSVCHNSLKVSPSLSAAKYIFPFNST
ncbi:hypothetical protein [Flavobacterium salmonis]|uniref:hypothetical protein n=1 Tax=Flavobacterium salmonis TaxID=2654844 RepID=UPI0015DDB93B|nr:hypothetical protein [Flavobacterium salmonis]